MKTIKNILLPTDLSDDSLAGVTFLQDLDIFPKANIFLLHVVEDIPQYAFPNIDATSPTLFRDTEETILGNLRRIIEQHFPAGTPVTPILRHGNPVKEIIAFAKDERIDLIVMSTHGRTGLRRVLIGSIAESVVRHSPVPVMTIKPQDMRSDIITRDDIEQQLHLEQEQR